MHMQKGKRYDTFGDNEGSTSNETADDVGAGTGVGTGTSDVVVPGGDPQYNGGGEADMADTDTVDVKDVQRDYECYCFGKKFINVAPKVVLTFTISILVIIFAFVYMFVKGDVVIFAPIVAGIIGFWLPSPTQSSQSRKDAVQSARLLQNNMRMNSMMMKYGMAKPRSFGSDNNV